MKTFIENVSILNMIHATPQSVAQLAGIDNAALVVVSPDSKPLLSQLSIGNLAMVLEVSEDTQLVTQNGKFELTRMTDQKRIALAVNGAMTVSPQLLPKEIQAFVAGGVVNGTLCASQQQMRALTDAGVTVNGKTIVYPDGAKPRSGRDPLTVGEAAALRMPAYLTHRVLIEEGVCQTLEAKGFPLYGADGAYLRPSDAEAFSRIWEGEGGITIIPQGYTMMESTQMIGRLNAAMLKDSRFFAGDLYLREDVTAQALSGLDALIVRGKVFMPEALSGELLRLLKNEPELIPYEGRLIKTDGIYAVESDDALEEDIALCVHGVLSVAPSVTPAALRRAVRLAYVDGLLRMSQAQQSALLPVLLGSFHMENAGQAEEEVSPPPNAPEHRIKNAMMYVL